MTEELKIPDAKTMEGVNIHLGFISQGIGEMRDGIKDTNVKIEEIKNSFVPVKVFDDKVKLGEAVHVDHEARIRTLEDESPSNKTVKIIVYGLCGIILSSFFIALWYLVVKN